MSRVQNEVGKETKSVKAVKARLKQAKPKKKRDGNGLSEQKSLLGSGLGAAEREISGLKRLKTAPPQTQEAAL